MSSAPAPDPAPDPARFGSPIRLGRLVLRPAAGPADLDAALTLRALAFRGGPAATDRDRWDDACLHLLAGPAGGPVLATLRLQPHPEGRIAGYAAQHYALQALAARPGPALELGRLCLHPAHPDPDLVRLLWAGVARAAGAWGAARLIGCTSLPGPDPAPLAPALALLARRHLGPQGLRPRALGPGTRALADFADAETPGAAALLPPLLRAYLALGGWVGAELVIDRDLGTCHVFTCLELDTMPPARRDRLRALAG